jgi:hypothetical protein
MEEYSLARSGDHMTSIAHSAATLQTSPQSVPATPMWFGEVALIAKHLAYQGIQTAIEQQVRFARRRFGKYGVIDFVVVLIGYALSGEPTLEAFYDHVLPFAAPFDEDTEQDPDRWCSHTACAQEWRQILAQWMWNLRLELGQVLHPMPLRTTQWAPADPSPLPPSPPIPPAPE